MDSDKEYNCAQETTRVTVIVSANLTEIESTANHYVVECMRIAKAMEKATTRMQRTSAKERLMGTAKKKVNIIL